MSGQPLSRIMPKSNYYRDDGTGRDLYIISNNGGLYHERRLIPEYPVSSFRPKRSCKATIPNSSHKKVRYISNGTGRDSYIYTCSGGFMTSHMQPDNKRTFASSLRAYDRCSSTGPIYNEDYSYTSRSWKTIKQRSLNSSIYVNQKKLAERLSKPKTYEL